MTSLIAICALVVGNGLIEQPSLTAAGFPYNGFGSAVAMDQGRAVIGQSANQASALSRKRASDTVSDVLTRDAIGQFPDQNVAESLRRLPGINILNDQGEGRFVSVRGLDSELVGDIVAMELDGARRNIQGRADLLDALPFGQQLQYFALPGGQFGRQLGRLGRAALEALQQVFGQQRGQVGSP